MKSILLAKKIYSSSGGIQTYVENLIAFWQEDLDVIVGEAEITNDLMINDKVKFSYVEQRLKPFLSSIFKLLMIFISGSINIINFLLLISNKYYLRAFISYIDSALQNRGRIQCPIVVICTEADFLIIGSILKTIFKSKLVLLVHGLDFQKSIVSKWQYRVLFKKAIESTDLIIANSNYTKSIVESNYNTKKIEVHNLGFDHRKFFPLGKSNELVLKHKLEGKKVLLTIGRLTERKGHDNVIKALSMVIKEIPNIKYLIGGKGDYLHHLQKLVDDLNLRDYVEFLGSIVDNEINDYMNLADVFIMPNRKVGVSVEGFGIVFLEAGACKKAVIAGKSGGAIDAVIDNETGILVDPYSIDTISNAITMLLKDDEKRMEMGNKGYINATRNASWERVIGVLQSSIKENMDD